MAVEPRPATQQKQYDYLLKFLLVGDSDVGKQEILSGLEDGSSESPFCSGSAYKTTTILLDGKRVKLQLWDTSGQGRFCTIIRSYSRGAQGILLVYDITNKWSFDGIDRWLKEVEEHAPGVPKVLVGNRLHLEFKRQVDARDAEAYAAKNRMAFFEVSPLCDFNIRESFSELSRMALHRNGMERLWRSNKVLSLQELCCRAIVARTTVYSIDQLPLPTSVKSHLKSYAMTTYTTTSMQHRYLLNHRSLGGSKGVISSHHKKLKFVVGTSPGIASPSSSMGSPPGVDSTRTSCTGRNSCIIS
ncbi:ras-related protein Rab-40C [Schistocerca americana]|uniref:ras-related protein Rab-40C n=1 Tax=Schistocerca americana TaxID=7009 RepID=UPI001E7FD35A|nr:ras-related protein Rab-40C [Schistocerca americana]XP_047105455.1 ras-related protein Rab-40C [Schistocerca piceifrons]XP_049774199.1 ras-related protein Rab-40C [Schistocerca cancellata]XP_049802199.1 ras-related protein Rab-40C [Schistocerca nitens]XP_049851821.1 ras-related protein Rab-40C [Schistocerca gregaria]XP_049949919.1 ras-related protein Rab-40C [Schistocerca serialis cubense]QZX57793.1 ras-related protein Rab40 [Locusta migratoria]